MKREAEQTVENFENRDNVRINHNSTLQVKDLQSGKIHKATMFNYSKGRTISVSIFQFY